MRLHFPIAGMTCAACVSHVEKAVKRVLSPQDTFTVSLLTNSLSVITEKELTEAEKEMLVSRLASSVKAAGYQLETGENKNEEKKSKAFQNARIRLIFSAVLTVILMYFSMGAMIGLPIPSLLLEYPIYMALWQLLLTIPVILINFKYFRGGFSALVHLSPNMDSLIATGSGAAVIYGIAVILLATVDPDKTHLLHHLYFESAAMILTLVSLGKLLESRAKDKAGDAVRALSRLSPKYATVIQNGQEKTVPVEEIGQGDLVLIRAGEWIPVDGCVIEGKASVDESALTGESLPVEKETGDKISAACILLSGAIKVRADKVGEETSLSRIIRLLEDAAASKAPIARIADRVSAVFVPAVMAISLVTFLCWMLFSGNFEKALLSAISVLVISCPCALGLATPTAITVGIGRGAGMGILFRNAQALEQLSGVKTLVFDKTGTLTEGSPVLSDVYAYGIDAKTLLQYAGSVEHLSSHPLAMAVANAAQKASVPFLPVEEFQSLIGVGARGSIAGKCCHVGKPQKRLDGQAVPVIEKETNETLSSLLEANVYENIDTGYVFSNFSELEQQGKSAVTVTLDGQVIGVLGISDKIRAESKTAVNTLKTAGVRVLMMTGDNEHTAAFVAEKTNLDGFYAGLLPADKEGMVKDLSAVAPCAMVGDGINDAPALVRADVGIAVGAGTDVAIDAADIVISGSSPTGVSDAYFLSRASIRVIKQNLFWALFYNAICIPVAAGVFYPAFGLQLNPMLASAAMSFSSLCVVSNALRLKKIDIKGEKKMLFEKKEKATVTHTLQVEGMMCQKCVAHVKEALESLKGVKEAAVDLESKTATVKAEESVTEAVVKAAVTKAGYEVK